jgi:hypothetical protein
VPQATVKKGCYSCYEAELQPTSPAGFYGPAAGRSHVKEPPAAAGSSSKVGEPSCLFVIEGTALRQTTFPR